MHNNDSVIIKDITDLILTIEFLDNLDWEAMQNKFTQILGDDFTPSDFINLLQKYKDSLDETYITQINSTKENAKELTRMMQDLKTDLLDSEIKQHLSDAKIRKLETDLKDTAQQLKEAKNSIWNSFTHMIADGNGMVAKYRLGLLIIVIAVSLGLNFTQSGKVFDIINQIYVLAFQFRDMGFSSKSFVELSKSLAKLREDITNAEQHIGKGGKDKQLYISKSRDAFVKYIETSFPVVFSEYIRFLKKYDIVVPKMNSIDDMQKLSAIWRFNIPLIERSFNMTTTDPKELEVLSTYGTVSGLGYTTGTVWMSAKYLGDDFWWLGRRFKQLYNQTDDNIVKQAIDKYVTGSIRRYT